MVEVPNVIGKSAAEANRILVNAGFNLSLSGALNFDQAPGAVVLAQSPCEGLLPRGSVISLTFRFLDDTTR
jgi:beta-lactam-binding protein with PASTA domain